MDEQRTRTSVPGTPAPGTPRIRNRPMRLRHSNASGRGYRRVAAGTGFSYKDLDGSTLPPGPVRERLESIGIPPAWTDVWIAPYDNGHIQATGTRRRRPAPVHLPPELAGEKGPAEVRPLPPARGNPAGRAPARHHGPALRGPRPGTACWPPPSGCWTADRCGSAPSATRTRTAATASPPCCAPTSSVRKNELRLSFPAKSGKNWESRIDDADLAAVVRQLKRRGGNARLLAYKDGRSWHPVSSADINEYVKERTGQDFTAKDFRTLRGTVAAAASLAKSGPQPKVSARKRAVSRAMLDASEVLGNTPSIARKSYVDPRVAGPLCRRGDHRPEAAGLRRIRGPGPAVPGRRRGPAAEGRGIAASDRSRLHPPEPGPNQRERPVGDETRTDGQEQRGAEGCGPAMP